ncbi:acyl-CoA N-acyltransferase [Piromyces finnis]|uniref:Acyl-CoA N-acyltransferase n=1 Tax=Piromyces finnis TaxID=1754191 RepID=A0A1Y1V097_9FUNG|nr:acyl-CoA N-acyltransferase [Piromyces finnis]|eukprot:ORX44382.1 acyl-CoA N-acyltransferase [Piromyces finnis]
MIEKIEINEENRINEKETSINNENNAKSEKLQEKNKHILTISPQIKLVEIKPQAAPFLFRLINENRYIMSEHIPYFQRIQGINDVIDFIKAKYEKVIETDYIFSLLTNKNAIKEKQAFSSKNNVNINNSSERNFLYFINYEKIPIGVIGLLNIDWYNRIGELHFWIAVRFQKKGFMSQVLPKMLDFLFYDVRLNRIIVKLRSTNSAGKMILKKFGFMLEGIERQSFYYIPENEIENGEGNVNKIKKQFAQIRHHRSKKNDITGKYYDMCVYSLISQDYV